MHHKNKTMQDNNNNPQNQINIELSEDIADGIYSNLAIISHSHSEFVLDFVRLMPNVPKAKVKARMNLKVFHQWHSIRLLRRLKYFYLEFEFRYI